MTSKLKMFALSFLATFGLLAGAVAPMALAQSVGTNSQSASGALNCGSTGNLTGEGCQSTAGADDKINKAIKLAIQMFQVVVGLIAVFMLIQAGLKYITSGGDSSGVGEAKNKILYAAVGLVVVALAQIIVSFVLNQVNKTTQL
jgi:uncharacterized membrane protein